MCHFKVGDSVFKPNGYEFSGVIISVCTKLNGEVRYVVENAEGILHVFSGSQLKLGEALKTDVFESELRELAKLEDGWDSYKAKPPNGISIDNAINILYAMNKVGFIPAKVGPTSMNGVFLKYKQGSYTLFVECYNYGKCHCMLTSKLDEEIRTFPANNVEYFINKILKIFGEQN